MLRGACGGVAEAAGPADGAAPRDLGERIASDATLVAATIVN